MSFGWGAGAWGASGWGGGGLGQGLALLDVQPIAENQLRLAFSLPLRFTGLLDPNDASGVGHYSVTALADTVGADGLPPRPVRAVLAALARVPGAGGRLIDLFVDRPMGPFPGQYVAAVNGLRASSGEPLLPGQTSRRFDGLAMAPSDPTLDNAAAQGDFANPQTVDGIGTSGVLPPEAALLLGSFPIDASGDYGIDQGVRSYKKRILRRLTARQGAFAHLASSTYGVGVPGYVKQLGRAGLREQIAANAEAQIRLEPETASCTVTIEQDPAHPEITRFKIRCKMITGQTADMNVPVALG